MTQQFPIKHLSIKGSVKCKVILRPRGLPAGFGAGRVRGCQCVNAQEEENLSYWQLGKLGF